MTDHFGSKRSLGHGSEGRVIHWAGAYEALFGWYLRRTQSTVVTLAAPIEGERVLDVCCGTGSLALTLKASLGARGSVHGIDASPEMINMSQHKALKAGTEVDFRVGLAQALPFPDKTFDLVVSQLAIHHLPGDLKVRAFEEMYRVLKPKGRCLIVDFEPPKGIPWRYLARLFHGHVMMQTNVRHYREMMEGVGFNDVEVGQTRHRMLAFIRGRKVLDGG
jgi:demethylmenaquinone methyltransferase/2-methoxy-6-polyprenyl-1,4-benzoquinol methylase/phosphoethanolamine N-methyltransferase